jgi:hypothetical protein
MLTNHTLIGEAMTTTARNNNEMIAQELLRKQGIIKQVFLDWIAILELKIRVYRERKQLLGLSDTMLNDLGITRAQAVAEALRSDFPHERLNALDIR